MGCHSTVRHTGQGPHALRKYLGEILRKCRSLKDKWETANDVSVASSKIYCSYTDAPTNTDHGQNKIVPYNNKHWGLLIKSVIGFLSRLYAESASSSLKWTYTVTNFHLRQWGFISKNQISPGRVTWLLSNITVCILMRWLPKPTVRRGSWDVVWVGIQSRAVTVFMDDSLDKCLGSILVS